MADEATARIGIDAPKSAVMHVIADFGSYPQWARYVSRAEVVQPGPSGRAKQVHFVLDAGIIKDDYTLEYLWEGDDAVHWHLVHGRALKLMDGTYALRESGGRTDVLYRLAVELHIPLLGIFKRKAEHVIMDTALRELKKRVEG